MGCLGCWCWVLFIIVVLALVLNFAVLPSVICSMMSGEHHPDAVWLAHTAGKDPSNWEFAGSQLKCKEWMDAIDVTDWQVDASDWKEVYFNSTDGLRLQGFFLKGKNGATTGIGAPSQAPTIIQVHGHGPYVGQQSQMIPAKGFQEQGFNVFLFNNQGLGKSEAPAAEYGMRTFGADELTNTAGAIEFLTTNPEGTLDFATPLNKVGFYVESGGNAMLEFFKRDLPGIVMHGSIYDWYAQWGHVAEGNGLGWWPGIDGIFMTCASSQARYGGIDENNYKDGLTKDDLYDPTGRKVLLMHNKADKYNPFELHAPHWEKDLKAAGFDVTTYYPDEAAGEEGCNSHITLLYALDRKAHHQKLCEYWESVFSVSASCSDVLAFDSKLSR